MAALPPAIQNFDFNSVADLNNALVTNLADLFRYLGLDVNRVKQLLRERSQNDLTASGGGPPRTAAEFLNDMQSFVIIYVTRGFVSLQRMMLINDLAPALTPSSARWTPTLCSSSLRL